MIFSVLSLSIGSTAWTEPLPKVFSPITIALLWSCNDPLTISEADAEPSFTSTTNGSLVLVFELDASNFSSSSAFLPFWETIIPLSTNKSTTPIAWDNNPPGLFLKSRIKPFLSLFSLIIFSKSSVTLASKLATLKYNKSSFSIVLANTDWIFII